MIYLANGFSPSMLTKLPLDVEFKEIDKDEFCEAVKHSINSIGHAGTIDLINKLCGTDLKMNRISIKADISDEIVIVLLTVRLEEGKVLSSEEIEQMYKEGKVKLIKAKIYGAVLEELSNCEGKCDEITYDSLSNKAKNGGEEE
jgi:hypothetical protein